MLQGLWFTNAVEWVCKGGANQVEDAQSRFAVRLNPVPEIGLEVTRNYRCSNPLFGHEIRSGLIFQSHRAAKVFDGHHFSTAALDLAE